MVANVYTLGAVANRNLPLGMICRRCHRRGQLNVADLLIEYGPDVAIVELTHLLTGDCPRRDSVAMNDRCHVFFPDLQQVGGAAR
jgi:hypothetical protein